MLIPIEILIAFPCAVIAYVYAGVLMEENHLLFGWWKLLNRHLQPVSKWLFTLLTCPLCMSGQFALWTYIFIAQFNIVSLVFTISLSILITKIFMRWS